MGAGSIGSVSGIESVGGFGSADGIWSAGFEARGCEEGEIISAGFCKPISFTGFGVSDADGGAEHIFGSFA